MRAIAAPCVALAHLERHRAARRAAARVCGLARLRAAALRLCGEDLRQDAARDAGDHLTERRSAGGSTHPALLVPNAEALAAAPARAEPLAREAEEAARAADEAKKAAANATREAASRAASLRKLEQLKARADAELARAEKALAAARTDQAKAKAEEAQQKAAAKAAEAATQLETARAEAKAKPHPAAVKDAAKAAETKKAAAAEEAQRFEAKLALRAGLDLYQPRDEQALRAAQHAPSGRGWRRHSVRLDDRGSHHNPRCRQADRHACVHRGGVRRCGPALDGGHDRRRGRRKERARPHHHLEGCARPHRADRVADARSPCRTSRWRETDVHRRAGPVLAAGRRAACWWRERPDGCAQQPLQRRRTLSCATRHNLQKLVRPGVEAGH